jgi:2'-5' RNA ligase
VRLFVASEIDAAVTSAAIALIAELRAHASRLAPRARITWLTADRIHLTLAFIGQVDEGRVPAIRDALRPPFTVRRFEARFRGLGAFPEHGRPRVLWAGVDEGREALMRLAGEVANRLRGVGIAIEERPHQPHVTLARVRDAAGVRTSALLAGREQVTLGTTVVGAITLFESRLSPAGSTYTAMARMALNGSSGQ